MRNMDNVVSAIVTYAQKIKTIKELRMEAIILAKGWYDKAVLEVGEECAKPFKRILEDAIEQYKKTE
jgi:hypothetical protein